MIRTVIVVQLIRYIRERICENDSEDEDEDVLRRRRLLQIAACALQMTSLERDINRSRITIFYPSGSAPVSRWDVEIFEKMFRRNDVDHVLDVMKLSGTSISCGRARRSQYFSAEICLRIVLRRLAYPCRFVDLVDIFGLPSNRICDIFHSTVDFLYTVYARKLNQYSIWTDWFPDFAKAMKDFGAPYENLVNIFDGHFFAVCRPGGLGNIVSRLDQSELYLRKGSSWH